MVEELHAKRRSPTEDSSAQLLTSLDQCLLLLRGDGSNASSRVRSLEYCRRVSSQGRIRASAETLLDSASQ